MNTSKASLSRAVSVLEKFFSAEDKKTVQVELKNMAVGLIIDHDSPEEKRDLAFVYLKGKNYWLVKLDGRIDKVSSLSIGYCLISLHFVSSNEDGMRVNINNASYVLNRKDEDIIVNEICI